MFGLMRKSTHENILEQRLEAQRLQLTQQMEEEIEDALAERYDCQNCGEPIYPVLRRRKVKHTGYYSHIREPGIRFVHRDGGERCSIAEPEVFDEDVD